MFPCRPVSFVLDHSSLHNIFLLFSCFCVDFPLLTDLSRPITSFLLFILFLFFSLSLTMIFLSILSSSFYHGLSPKCFVDTFHILSVKFSSFLDFNRNSWILSRLNVSRLHFFHIRYCEMFSGFSWASWADVLALFNKLFSTVFEIFYRCFFWLLQKIKKYGSLSQESLLFENLDFVIKPN